LRFCLKIQYGVAEIGALLMAVKTIKRLLRKKPPVRYLLPQEAGYRHWPEFNCHDYQQKNKSQLLRKAYFRLDKAIQNREKKMRCIMKCEILCQELAENFI